MDSREEEKDPGSYGWRTLGPAVAFSLLLHIGGIMLLVRHTTDEPANLPPEAEPVASIRISMSPAPVRPEAADPPAADPPPEVEVFDEIQRTPEDSGPSNPTLATQPVPQAVLPPPDEPDPVAGGADSAPRPEDVRRAVSAWMQQSQDSRTHCLTSTLSNEMITSCGETAESGDHDAPGRIAFIDYGRVRSDLAGQSAPGGKALSLTGSGNADDAIHMLNLNDRLYMIRRRVMAYP